MPSGAALRDVVRSTPLGPIIRDFVIRPMKRYDRLRKVKRAALHDQSRFECNLCGYAGLFSSVDNLDGTVRAYAFCPNCGSAERHRLQCRVIDLIAEVVEPHSKSLLHFAPEPVFKQRFQKQFQTYKTADLFRADVDLKVDLTDMRIPEASHDVVYASHVLEHIQDDRKAVSEIFRILRPGGIAIIPVPIYSVGSTVEYHAPRPEEEGHVRAPGLADYFDRYRNVFDQVVLFSSDCFGRDAELNQLYIREIADGVETSLVDVVPVCVKSDPAHPEKDAAWRRLADESGLARH